MKAYEVQTLDGTGGLRQVERASPSIGPGQVRIKVKAASLNYRDLLMTQREAGQTLPLVPLSDGAGEIVEVGEGVSRWKTGDRVAGTFFQGWRAGGISAEVFASALGGARDGMLAEEVVLDEWGVVALPPHMSWEEGATLSCAGLTAWNALFEAGNLRAGETVVLLGTGGVSLFALQFARLAGARTIITSSSDEKLERARSLGADETINYKTTPDWDKRVWELNGKQGADHIVEVGGTGTLPHSLRAVRVGGTITLIGLLEGGEGIDPLPVLFKAARLQGVYVGSLAMFEAMNRALSLHRLQPVIDRVYGFDEAAEEYRLMASAGHFGKIVIRL